MARLANITESLPPVFYASMLQSADRSSLPPDSAPAECLSIADQRSEAEGHVEEC